MITCILKSKLDIIGHIFSCVHTVIAININNYYKPAAWWFHWYACGDVAMQTIKGYKITKVAKLLIAIYTTL